MLILWICKYFISIIMTSKAIEGHKSSSNFSFNTTLPYWMVRWCFPLQILCISLSLTFYLVLSSILFLFPSLYLTLSLSLSFAPCIIYLHTGQYVLKVYMRQLLCCVIFKNSQISWSNYIIDLRSYGQLLSLFSGIMNRQNMYSRRKYYCYHQNTKWFLLTFK